MNKNSIRITFNAPVILAFALVCVISLIVNSFTNGMINNRFALYYTSLTDPMMYVRLFTYPLCHSNLSHLVSNMTLFLVVGPSLEEKYGSKSLIFAMVVTSVISGIFWLIFNHSSGLVGCSGIVFMMIILISFSGKRGGIPLTFILVVILYLFQQISSALQVNNVSEMTHILGGCCGAFIGFKFRR